MIRLFASDIDGCLSEPFQPSPLSDLAKLRELASHQESPALTICTGRPLGYAEAMAQVLGIRVPILFEAGGGMFDPITGVRTWHPDFGAKEEDAVREIKGWLARMVPGTTMMVEDRKHTQAGLIGADTSEIASAIAPVERFVGQHFPGFVVAFTPISIDVMRADLTKREGLAWLSSRLGIPMAEIAFIGDSGGDLRAIQAVGTSFAPANATAEVRSAAAVVTEGRVSAGVLEAYRTCIERNRSFV